jgi:hypothetical protein
MNRFAPELGSETPDPAFEFVQDEEASMRPWIPVLRCQTNFPADLVRYVTMSQAILSALLIIDPCLV